MKICCYLDYKADKRYILKQSKFLLQKNSSVPTDYFVGILFADCQ